MNLLFTEFNMDDALAVRFEKGVEEGQHKSMADLIGKKLAKGKSLDQIADELETNIDTIQQIITQAAGRLSS